MFELRQTYRALSRRPAYAAASIGTLALVIGVNAALRAWEPPIGGLKVSDRRIVAYDVEPENGTD